MNRAGAKSRERGANVVGKLSDGKNFVVELRCRLGVFQRFGVLDVPSESSKHTRWIGIDTVPTGDAMKIAHHLLAFFRQRKIDEKSRRVWMRRLCGDHDRIDLHEDRFQRDPIDRRAPGSEALQRIAGGQGEWKFSGSE